MEAFSNVALVILATLAVGFGLTWSECGLGNGPSFWNMYGHCMTTDTPAQTLLAYSFLGFVPITIGALVTYFASGAWRSKKPVESWQSK